MSWFHFVKVKDYTDLASFWRLTLPSNYYVDVYVWNSEVGLFANTHFRKKTYAGAWIAYPGLKRGGGLFGEIHLIRDMIGGGYVVHELTHLLLYWILWRAWSLGRSNEKIAYLMGELTREFFDIFYDRYETVQKLPQNREHRDFSTRKGIIDLNIRNDELDPKQKKGWTGYITIDRTPFQTYHYVRVLSKENIDDKTSNLKFEIINRRLKKPKIPNLIKIIGIYENAGGGPDGVEAAYKALMQFSEKEQKEIKIAIDKKLVEYKKRHPVQSN